MNNTPEINEMRIKLYEEVWNEPMTTLAKKYGLSDNGLRKRCVSLNIPIPSLGYWAKLKAGKSVEERPPLPTYIEDAQEPDEVDEPVFSEAKRKGKGSITLLDSEDLSIDQLKNMHGLELLKKDSLDVFLEFCNSIRVPDRVHDYDDLITQHKSELEYRTLRDKEYPFREHFTRPYYSTNKVKIRDDISVPPIEVSKSLESRAYRIADTLIKTFRKLNASISVESIKVDNIRIKIFNTVVSFKIFEIKIKRRHFQDKTIEFRPLYEEVYSGMLQINWSMQIDWDSNSIYPYRFNKNQSKNQFIYLNHCDSNDRLIEDQISEIIIEVYKQCCENEIKYWIEQKKVNEQLKRNEDERLAYQNAEKVRINEEKNKERRETLIKEIPKQAENWFEYEQLSRYLQELETYLSNCSDEETIRLLQDYIELVKENIKECNPIPQIIEEMRLIKLENKSI